MLCNVSSEVHTEVNDVQPFFLTLLMKCTPITRDVLTLLLKCTPMVSDVQPFFLKLLMKCTPMVSDVQSFFLTLIMKCTPMVRDVETILFGTYIEVHTHYKRPFEASDEVHTHGK